MGLAPPPLRTVKGAQEFIDLVWKYTDEAAAAGQSTAVILDQVQAAVAARLPPAIYVGLDRGEWFDKGGKVFLRRHAEAHQHVVANGYKFKQPYLEFPLYQVIMGLRMRPRLPLKALLDLPWPDEVPVLRPDDLCPYLERAPGKKPYWDWVKDAFDPGQHDGVLYEQFCLVLFDVINEHVDRQDRGRVSLADVPSPKVYTTRAPYSADEAAAWWREALNRVGYDV